MRSVMNRLTSTVIAFVLAGLAAAGPAEDDAALDSGAPPASAPTAKPATRKGAGSNMGLWLGESVPASPQPASASSATAGANPFGPGGPAGNEEVPGVIELSDGQLLAGGLSTTVEKPWLVWVASEKRWRRVPLITLLGWQAVVVEEEMALSWRWKAMGEPERVYTGKKYPTRRFEWRFHLIDDSYISGSVKGQPLWVRTSDGKRRGPFVLHERSKGKDGQTLKDLVYIRRVIVSRRMMELVIAQQKENSAHKRDSTPAATQPANP